MIAMPDGWAIEPEDRSVGIFGDAIWHDGCPKFEADPMADSDLIEPYEVFVGYVGWGINRQRTGVVLLTCPACHRTGVTVWYEWDPPEDAWEGNSGR